MVRAVVISGHWRMLNLEKIRKGIPAGFFRGKMLIQNTRSRILISMFIETVTTVVSSVVTTGHHSKKVLFESVLCGEASQT